MTARTEMNGIRACVFDAYGTLFDVHSAVSRYRQRMGRDADAISALWRDKQLQYTWLRSLMGRYADFSEITAQALDFALASYGVHDNELRRDLLTAYQRLDAYQEVPAVLSALRGRGVTTAILTNGTRALLDPAIQGAGLDTLLDAVLTVEPIRVYKPDPRVYRLVEEELGVPAEAVLFHSSNAWDAAGAAAFGFRVAWVNRFGQVPERLPDGPDIELESLVAVPDLLRDGRSAPG